MSGLTANALAIKILCLSPPDKPSVGDIISLLSSILLASSSIEANLYIESKSNFSPVGSSSKTGIIIFSFNDTEKSLPF